MFMQLTTELVPTMIDIVVSNGEPYIWQPQDWYKLRTEHRIMGSFDGALAENGSTESRLPFKLMKVEAQFLIKHGIAKTVQPPKRLSLMNRPVAEEVYTTLRQERMAKQLEDHKVRKRSSLEVLVGKIIQGKKRKGKVVPDRQAIIDEEMSKIRKVPYEFVEVEYKDPWVTYDEYSPHDFPMPSGHLDKLQLRVFEDFNLTRQYFLTCGVKFGGDFLAYPGDPTKYHAEFIIRCEHLGRQIPNVLLRAHERLAIGVRKTLLIASLDPETDKVTYRAGRKSY